MRVEELEAILFPPPSPPVGYWKFDEGNGTVAYDSSEYGNDGTLYGSCSWVDGKYGKALWFSGGGSYVRIPNSQYLNCMHACSHLITSLFIFSFGCLILRGCIKKRDACIEFSSITRTQKYHI